MLVGGVCVELVLGLIQVNSFSVNLAEIQPILGILSLFVT